MLNILLHCDPVILLLYVDIPIRNAHMSVKMHVCKYQGIYIVPKMQCQHQCYSD